MLGFAVGAYMLPLGTAWRGVDVMECLCFAKYSSVHNEPRFTTIGESRLVPVSVWEFLTGWIDVHALNTITPAQLYYIN